MIFGKKFVKTVNGNFIQVYKIFNILNNKNIFVILIIRINIKMNSKLIEYFQQENNNIEVPSIDGNYILLNRGIKFLLNFLLIYSFALL